MSGPPKNGMIACGIVRAMWKRPMSLADWLLSGSVSQASAQSTAK
jgi:hypothetical protein